MLTGSLLFMVAITTGDQLKVTMAMMRRSGLGNVYASRSNGTTDYCTTMEVDIGKRSN